MQWMKYKGKIVKNKLNYARSAENKSNYCLFLNKFGYLFGIIAEINLTIVFLILDLQKSFEDCYKQ